MNNLLFINLGSSTVKATFLTGQDLKNTCLMNPDNIIKLKKSIGLAPLHNQNVYRWIEITRELFKCSIIGVFDTTFFKDLPDVSRVVFPADSNSSMALFREIFSTRGQIWNVVAAKGKTIQFFDENSSVSLARKGAYVLRRAANPLLELVAIGAYQLEQVMLASKLLDSKKVEHTTCMGEIDAPCNIYFEIIMKKKMNEDVVRLLEYFARLLAEQKGMTHQSNTYEKAALEVSRVTHDLCSMTPKELDEIPYVGKVISSEIEEYCKTGAVKYLERLLIISNPVTVLKMAKGFGEEKTRDLIEALNIESFRDLLEEYEDGRIGKYLGKESVSYKRVSELLEFLPSWVKSKHEAEKKLKDIRPSTTELLEIDREFREHYNFDINKNLTMKKLFNGGQLRVFFSRSEKARRFHANGDWVNVHFEKDKNYLKWVILTSKYGSLKGKRVVLGEEKASKRAYSDDER